MGKRKRSSGGRGEKGSRCREVVFDPEARKAYLQGFSERKRQRRAYGLAMQKVKDRKAKIEQRAEIKQAMEQQVEEAEKQKEEILNEYVLQNERSAIGRVKFRDVDSADQQELEKVQTYEDVQTKTQWGGEVIVTTSTKIPGESEDEDDQNSKDSDMRKRRKKSKDEEQEYAGNVEKYLNDLKGNMPGKKKHTTRIKHRGRHGAANMKGMAASGDLKIAQKALERSQAAVNLKSKGKGKHGRRRRR